MKSAIWFSWEKQRRNQELSHKLGIKFFQFEEIDQIVHNPIKKYARGLSKTVPVVIKEKPRIIVCQNPSIVLSLCAVIFGKLSTTKIVIDAHNVGLYPLEGRSRSLMAISRFIQRYAHLTIVTNEGLKRVVERNGGRGYVLPDPIPDLPGHRTIALKKCFNILFICSYAKDEPYENVLKAAALLDDTFHIYVTGNYRKGRLDPKKVPPNVTLLGYVSDEKYADMLHAVDATIDLTDREDCLVCGAYESVAAEKPMILSSTRALRDHFSKGAVYTDNSAASLVTAMKGARQDHERLLKEVRSLKVSKQNQWVFAGKGLSQAIQRLLDA